jgi:hypothetical protein
MAIPPFILYSYNKEQEKLPWGRRDSFKYRKQQWKVSLKKIKLLAYDTIGTAILTGTILAGVYIHDYFSEQNSRPPTEIIEQNQNKNNNSQKNLENTLKEF